MNVTLVGGDLLDQPVEAVVSARHRNLVPCWLLRPQGVSGAIRRRAGTIPFKELWQFGRCSGLSSPKGRSSSIRRRPGMVVRRPAG